MVFSRIYFLRSSLNNGYSITDSGIHHRCRCNGGITVGRAEFELDNQLRLVNGDRGTEIFSLGLYYLQVLQSDISLNQKYF